ncbi:hypothetical protein PIN31009_04472 [Pandoraea iniqua]|nr:hypothetical protein PIN31009_04472 [Pandoraea iniqua]
MSGTRKQADDREEMTSPKSMDVKEVKEVPERRNQRQGSKPNVRASNTACVRELTASFL